MIAKLKGIIFRVRYADGSLSARHWTRMSDASNSLLNYSSRGAAYDDAHLVKLQITETEIEQTPVKQLRLRAEERRIAKKHKDALANLEYKRKQLERMERELLEFKAQIQKQ